MEIKEIKNWFEIAIPEPTIEQAAIQIGCHFEEVAEMTDATCDYDLELELKGVSESYKDGGNLHIELIEFFTRKDQVKLLDSLCDQIVTAIGVAHMLGMDIEGALAEVNDSNHSKFESGKALFNEQGKITKGKNYTAPKLDKFIQGC